MESVEKDRFIEKEADDSRRETVLTVTHSRSTRRKAAFPDAPIDAGSPDTLSNRDFVTDAAAIVDESAPLQRRRIGPIWAALVRMSVWFLTQ